MSAAADAPIVKLGHIYRMLIGDYHYTGSTIETIEHRFRKHQEALKTKQKKSNETYKVYKHILENGGWEAVKIIELESNIPEDKLLQKEDSYINLTDPFCLNTYRAVAKIVPPRTPMYKRGEKKRETDKSYYEANKERLKKQRMERYKRDKEDDAKYERIKEVALNAQTRYSKKMKGVLKLSESGEE